MNTYSWYIKIIYYKRLQKTVNIFKQFTMGYLTYTCHPLSIFKLLIEDNIHYYPLSTQNVFIIFTYDSTYAWRRNSVGYIIKFPNNFFNLLNKRVMYPFPCLSFFRVQPIFLPSLLHNPSLPHYFLLKM